MCQTRSFTVWPINHIVTYTSACRVSNVLYIVKVVVFAFAGVVSQLLWAAGLLLSVLQDICGMARPWLD
jgi:hypothetical protein